MGIAPLRCERRCKASGRFREGKDRTVRVIVGTGKNLGQQGRRLSGVLKLHLRDSVPSPLLRARHLAITRGERTLNQKGRRE